MSSQNTIVKARYIYSFKNVISLLLNIPYKIRGPSGSSVTGIVPTNAYPCLPSPNAPNNPAYIVIGANADSMYNRMMIAMGHADLTGPKYAQNQHRVEHQKEIEEAISNWTKTRTAEEVEEVLRAVSVPCGRVFSVKEVVENPHTEARGGLWRMFGLGVRKTGGM